jgi:hypothetical protein
VMGPVSIDVVEELVGCTTNEKFLIVAFFCYLDPKGLSYLAPTLFDTLSNSYLTPTLFGPKSSYLAPCIINILLLFSHSLSSTQPLYHFLPTPILVYFYVEFFV